MVVVAVAALGVGAIVLRGLTSGPSLTIRVTEVVGDDVFLQGELDPPTAGVRSQVEASTDGGESFFRYGSPNPVRCCTTGEDGRFEGSRINQTNPGEYCFRLRTLTPVEDDVLRSNTVCVDFG